MTEKENSLFLLLGELAADVKHIKQATDLSREETAKLRSEVREELGDLEKRMDKQERFQTKLMAYGSAMGLVVTIGVSLLVNFVSSTF